MIPGDQAAYLNVLHASLLCVKTTHMVTHLNSPTHTHTDLTHRCVNPMQSSSLSPQHYNGDHMTTTSLPIAMATTAPLLRQQLQSATTSRKKLHAFTVSLLHPVNVDSSFFFLFLILFLFSPSWSFLSRVC